MTTNDEVGPYDVTPILHSRYFILPASAAMMGTLIGAVRGSRQASLRYLAENAHRPPTTVQGWYFYNKTKNYRRMAAGLQEGGRNAVKLGVAALVWVGIEDGLERCGQPWAEAKELGAGVGTASVFAVACKLSRCPRCRTLWTCLDLSRPASMAFGSSGDVSWGAGGRGDGISSMGQVALGGSSVWVLVDKYRLLKKKVRAFVRIADAPLCVASDCFIELQIAPYCRWRRSDDPGRSTHSSCGLSYHTTNTTVLVTVLAIALAPFQGNDQVVAIRARAAHTPGQRRWPRAPKSLRRPRGHKRHIVVLIGRLPDTTTSAAAPTVFHSSLRPPPPTGDHSGSLPDTSRCYAARPPNASIRTFCRSHSYHTNISTCTRLFHAKHQKVITTF